MRSMLIVDDQDAVRQRAIEIVAEMGIGIGPIYEASDGVRALECIEEYRPDIALVDIVMPNMDGFEFIKRIHAGKYATHIVIITSYSDFDYTKRAITLRVDDYILKPLSVKELYGVLISVMDKMDKEDEDTFRSREKELDYHRMVLYEYMTGADVFTDMKRILDSVAAISLSHQQFSVLALDMQHHTLEEMRSFMTELEKYFSSQGIAWLAINEKSLEIVYILNCNVTHQQLLAVKLGEYLSHSNYIFNGGLSNALEGIKSLRELYRQANLSLRESIFNRSIFTAYSAIKNHSRNFIAIGVMEKMLDLLKHEKKDEFEKHLNTIFTEMTRERWSARDVGSGFADIMNYLDINLKNLYPEVCDLGLHNYSDDSKDILQMKHNVRELIVQICSIVWEPQHKDIPSLSVNWVVNFINANYNKDITLAFISNELNMNYYYVSSQFSKIAGISFSEYLMKTRIDKAKELLSNTSEKIVNIAASVGFKDVQYFCKAFKKITLMTPNQYRESFTNS